MEIRLANKTDYDAFNEMYVSFYEKCKREPMPIERYEKILELEGIYFAVEDGKNIGFAILYAFEEIGVKIELFYVKEKNKGYGAKFYDLIEKEVRESNINRIFLYVLDERPERFWQRRGFKSVNFTEEYEKFLN